MAIVSEIRVTTGGGPALTRPRSQVRSLFRPPLKFCGLRYFLRSWPSRRTALERSPTVPRNHPIKWQRSGNGRPVPPRAPRAARGRARQLRPPGRGDRRSPGAGAKRRPRGGERRDEEGARGCPWSTEDDREDDDDCARETTSRAGHRVTLATEQMTYQGAQPTDIIKRYTKTGWPMEQRYVPVV